MALIGVLVDLMDNIEHLLISLCLQAVIGLTTDNWWAIITEIIYDVSDWLKASK
jgi:hypothetical protein